MSGKLHRREVVAGLLAGRDENLLVVSGLGSSCWDVAAAGDVPQNFYVWGAMGAAAMIGLGLAQAQPEKRVLVVTGDGEMLMGMGAFATIAAQAPTNLAVVVLDNGRYGETGGQPTHTAGVADLAKIAAAAGVPRTTTVTSEADLGALRKTVLELPGPSVSVVKVVHETLKFVLPSSSGPYLKDRFRLAVLGEGAA